MYPYYDSPTHYYTWEKASATVKLNATVDDPYAISMQGDMTSVCFAVNIKYMKRSNV